MYTLSLMLMFYVKLFMKYRKASFLFSMAAILNIAKNGGSIKISGCFHQNSKIVWHGGHLCQISCFCPDVKISLTMKIGLFGVNNLRPENDRLWRLPTVSDYSEYVQLACVQRTVAPCHGC